MGSASGRGQHGIRGDAGGRLALAARPGPTGRRDPPVQDLAQDPLFDTRLVADLLERLVAAERIGDIADGRHDRVHEPDAARRRLQVEAPGMMADEVLDERLGLGHAGLPGGRILADDLVRVLAVRQPHDADVLELDARVVALELPDEPGQRRDPERAGLLAGGVHVVGERDAVGVAGQEPDVVRGEGRPQAGDDVLEAGLVGHQGVRVALDDDGLAGSADGALGLVDEIQRPALVEQRRRRGVEVLGPLPFQQPPAETHGMTVGVADREQHAGAELVDDAAAALAGAGQADLDELLGPDVALGLELAGHLVPAGGRPAELVHLDRRVREAAVLEVGQRALARPRPGQDGVVEGDRGIEDLAEARPAGVLALGAFVDLDAGACGQRAERLGEGRPIPLHDEAEDVAAQPAAEAVPRLAAGCDHERRCLLAVEGAQALVGGASLLQRDRFADDIDDRQLALDLGSDADRQIHSFAPRTSRCRSVHVPGSSRQDPNTPVGLSSLDKPGRPRLCPDEGDLSTPLSIPLEGIRRGSGHWMLYPAERVQRTAPPLATLTTCRYLISRELGYGCPKG